MRWVKNSGSDIIFFGPIFDCYGKAGEDPESLLYSEGKAASQFNCRHIFKNPQRSLSRRSTWLLQFYFFFSFFLLRLLLLVELAAANATDRRRLWSKGESLRLHVAPIRSCVLLHTRTCLSITNSLFCFLLLHFSAAVLPVCLLDRVSSSLL